MAIKRILIPTDFSETAQLAIEHGTYMAHLFKAKIFLLHSITTPVYSMMTEESDVLIESGVRHEVDQEQKLHKVADELVKKYNVDMTPIVINASPAKGIAEAAKENKIDIIIMGTHGVSGFDEFFAGSNTHKVVNLAPCPVISVQASSKWVGFSNIVLPIDNDLHSRQKINNAIELAKVYKSTVHILGLLEIDAEDMEEKRLEIKLDSLEDKLNHAGIPFSRKLIRGHNLAVEAMNHSAEVKGDLIVIMTGHESDMTGMFMGAFAEQIVNHSKIPVMSIKPEETTIEVFDPTGGTGVII